MLSVKFRIYFSDFFGVDPKAVEEYGAFNISLINDLPLFIDPFLLFNSEKTEYQKLHEQIIKYALFLKGQSGKNIPEGLIKSWFCFPEIKENWFGYSRVGNSGRGLGTGFALALKKNFTTVLENFGEENNTGTHLEKLTLVKNGVGKDQISDLTCNLIAGYLAEFTETFALAHINPALLQKFQVQKAVFNEKTQTWAARQYTLPRYGNQFVLLTPVDMLTKDEAWISHRGFVEDFTAVLGSVSNEELRSKIDRYLISVTPMHATVEAREEAIEKVIEKYPELLDFYISLREKDRLGANLQSAAKVAEAHQLFVDQLKKLVKLLDETDFYKTRTNSYTEGMARVQFLKHVIESQDGYRLFYVKGAPIRREPDLQIMFKLTWFAADFDSNSEVNNGRGPADFVISYGRKDKSVIEFKLAKNTHLEKNLKKQAEIYSGAAAATHPPIKAIIYFNDRELKKVQAILKKLNLLACKEVVLIDARSKVSGSRAN